MGALGLDLGPRPCGRAFRDEGARRNLHARLEAGEIAFDGHPAFANGCLEVRGGEVQGTRGGERAHEDGIDLAARGPRDGEGITRDQAPAEGPPRLLYQLGRENAVAEGGLLADGEKTVSAR